MMLGYVVFRGGSGGGKFRAFDQNRPESSAVPFLLPGWGGLHGIYIIWVLPKSS